MYCQRRRFLHHLIWIQCSPVVLFRHNVKKIKDGVHKNEDIDSTYKQSLKFTTTWTATNVLISARQQYVIQATVRL